MNASQISNSFNENTEFKDAKVLIANIESSKANCIAQHKAQSDFLYCYLTQRNVFFILSWNFRITAKTFGDTQHSIVSFFSSKYFKIFFNAAFKHQMITTQSHCASTHCFSLLTNRPLCRVFSQKVTFHSCISHSSVVVLLKVQFFERLFLLRGHFIMFSSGDKKKSGPHDLPDRKMESVWGRGVHLTPELFPVDSTL